MKPLLLQRWPDLDLPWSPLGIWPTPSRPATDLPGLWIKDEGACGASYGGNKIRKLEWLLADAQRKGAGDVLTVGAVGSNHVLATALYARQLGLRPYAVLTSQPDTAYVRRNARLIDALCEGWITSRSVAGVPWAWTREWAALTMLGGRAPYVIGPGASDPLGTVGWVSAGLEIAQDVAEGRMPSPDRVYVAVGSSGTAAGLLLGMRMGGLSSELVGVRVVDRWLVSEGRIRRLASATASLLRRHGADLEVPALDGVRMLHDWYCDGYGLADARVLAAIERASSLELGLDATYTGKAFGACVAELEQQGGRALFVSTVNGQPLDALLAEALADVPEGMRPLLRP